MGKLLKTYPLIIFNKYIKKLSVYYFNYKYYVLSYQLLFLSFLIHHYINEGIDIILDDDMVKKYKKVFREIFYRLGHGEHYNIKIIFKYSSHCITTSFIIYIFIFKLFP